MKDEIKMADYKNKVLLVTGGSGSFGQTMVQYFLNTDIKEIWIIQIPICQRAIVTPNCNGNIIN